MSDNFIKGRIKTTTTTVTTTATALPSTALVGRRTMLITNIGANTVWLGEADVIVGKGTPIVTNEKLSFEIGEKVIMYGRTSAGTADIRTLEGV